MGELAESKGDSGRRSHLFPGSVFWDQVPVFLENRDRTGSIPMPLAKGSPRLLLSRKGHCSPFRGFKSGFMLLLTNQLQLRGGCTECEMRWERSADKCDG